jgi:alkylated DNA nucleotide flippase Atl1
MRSARQASELIKLVQEYSGLSLGRIIYVAGLAGLMQYGLDCTRELLRREGGRAGHPFMGVRAVYTFIDFLHSTGTNQ